MKCKDTFKTRPSIENAKPAITEFFKSQRLINVAINSSPLPIIDGIDYFFTLSGHVAVIPPMSKIANHIENGSRLSAFIQDGFGKGSKKFYAEIICEVADKEDVIIKELLEVNPMMQKMLSHGGKVFKLTFENGIISLSHAEVYNIDSNLNPTFAKLSPNGKERFENSRKVLMQYLDREVIFNVYVENGVYHCLAKIDSRKIEYIKNNGICKIFDGEDNHFETAIQIDGSKTDVIYEKLKQTNNSFFKENVGLTALSFSKPQ